MNGKEQNQNKQTSQGGLTSHVYVMGVCGEQGKSNRNTPYHQGVILINGHAISPGKTKGDEDFESQASYSSLFCGSDRADILKIKIKKK